MLKKLFACKSHPLLTLNGRKFKFLPQPLKGYTIKKVTNKHLSVSFVVYPLKYELFPLAPALSAKN